MNKTINKKLTSSSELTSWPLIDSNFELSRDTSYPKISIVTPSYNQGQFLEKTIRSVLLQSYPNLEYIIMDGGSNDQSVEIIKKYEPWLTHWESKPDKGQTDAINQGMKLATGDIVAYINSDDYYLPGTFELVRNMFSEGKKWITGAVYYTSVKEDTENSYTKRWAPDETTSPNDLLIWLARGGGLPQPGVFWKRSFLDKYGYFREDMHYCFDTEYWIRLLFNGEKLSYINEDFAKRIIHPSCKTELNPELFDKEFEKICNYYLQKLSQKDLILYKTSKKKVKTRKLINNYNIELRNKKYLKATNYLIKAFEKSPKYFLEFAYYKYFKSK